jgi:hypothetical protein
VGESPHLSTRRSIQGIPAPNDAAFRPVAAGNSSLDKTFFENREAFFLRRSQYR